MSGLYASANAMRNLMQRQEAIANNLANLETPAFKRSVMATHGFGEALDETMTKSAQSLMPISEGGIDLSQGPLQASERELDLALEGPGFFVVQTPQGERYTRAGNLRRDEEGRLTDQSGHLVLGQGGPIKLGEGPVSVRRDGTIQAGDQQGTLRLVKLPTESLVAVGGNLFSSSAKAEPADGVSVRQGQLERANTDSIQELVGMIRVQRSYEAAGRSLQTVLAALERAASELR